MAFQPMYPTRYPMTYGSWFRNLVHDSKDGAEVKRLLNIAWREACSGSLNVTEKQKDSGNLVTDIAQKVKQKTWSLPGHLARSSDNRWTDICRSQNSKNATESLMTRIPIILLMHFVSNNVLQKRLLIWIEIAEAEEYVIWISSHGTDLDCCCLRRS